MGTHTLRSMTGVRVYRVPFSTNVERVALACGHKAIPVEWIDVPAADRSAVEAASGQGLVPVLVAEDEVIADSPQIIRWLEEHYPEPPLFPADPARRAEVETFVDWFNRVWKVPPNAIDTELDMPQPDRGRIDAWGAEVTGALDRFEALLSGREWLMGAAFSVADVTAYPFLRYMTWWDEGDPDRFHAILRDYQPAGGHPRLERWIGRIDALPRA
jgi:maleylpyruvate isomerase